MKKNIFILAMFMIVLGIGLTSCDSLFEPEDEEENYLPTPTVKYTSGTVSISCDAAASDNILWINVFRKNASDQDNEFINIGQVLPYTGLSFSNSAQFTDEHINGDTEYEYYIRYARKNGSKVSYERTSANKIRTDSSAKGELQPTSANEVSLTYELKEGAYTLTGAAPSFSTGEAYLSVSNGTKTVPVHFSSGMDLRDVLPTDFLDVPITFGVFVAQLEYHDEVNKVTNYYWSLPVKVKELLDSEGKTLKNITVPSSAIAGSDVDYNPADKK